MNKRADVKPMLFCSKTSWVWERCHAMAQ